MTPEEQLAAIKAKLSELFGLAVGASDQDFASAFEKYVTDASKEGEDKAAADKKSEEDFAAKAKEMAAKHKTEMDAIVSRYDATVTELKSKNTEISDELGKLKIDASAVAAKNFESEVSVVLDGLVKEGKMLPAELAINKNLLMNADRVTKHKFSDAEGKEIESTQFDSLVNAFKSRPQLVKFQELSKNVEEKIEVKTEKVAPNGVQRFESAGLTVDERSAKIDVRTRQLMTEKNIGYGAAMSLAVKENK